MSEVDALRHSPLPGQSPLLQAERTVIVGASGVVSSLVKEAEHDAAPINVRELIETTPASPLQWSIFAICGLLMLLEGFDLQVIGFAAPAIAGDWHLASSEFGPVLSAGLFGGILGAVLIAPLGDRFGPRLLLLLSTLTFGTFTLVTAFATNLAQIVVLRSIAGAGIGAFVPSLVTVLSAYAPLRHRSFLIAAATVFQLLGASLGGLVSVPLMTAFGWPSIFLLGGLAPLVLLVPVTLFLPEPISFLVSRRKFESLRTLLIKMGKPAIPENLSFSFGTEPIAKANIVELLSRRRRTNTLLLWIAVFAGVLFTYFIVNWLPLIMKDRDASLSQSVYSSVVFTTSGIIGSLVVGRVLDGLGKVRVIAIGYVLAGLAMFAVGLHEHADAVVLVLIFLCGFFGFGVQSCLAALIVSFYPPELHNTALGATMAIGRSGAALGLVIGGYLLSMGLAPFQLLSFAAAAAIVAGVSIAGMRVQQGELPT